LGHAAAITLALAFKKYEVPSNPIETIATVLGDPLSQWLASKASSGFVPMVWVGPQDAVCIQLTR